MLPIEKCIYSPVPALRAGELPYEELKERLAPGFINWNPATGSTQGLPDGLGWQPFRTRLQGSKVINESSARIMASLDEVGQINPALLWWRNGRLWSAYGGTRVLWAWLHNHPLKCLIVDYDGGYKHFRKVAYSKILGEFKEPPLGIVPLKFGWAYGRDYIICDSREWQMKSEEEWEESGAVV